jgi:peptidoglycan hydrolase-like protein with peptidoglycan-binding domain
MKLHDIAVAAAVLSFASTAVAAGNDATTSSGTPASGQAYSSGQQNAQSPSSSTSSSPSSQQNDSNASSAQSQNAQTMREVQQALKQKGFDVGAIDGQMGPETQSALRDFQQSQGLPQSGNLDSQTLSALGVSAQGATSPGSSAQSPGSHASGTQGAMSSGSRASSGSRDTDQDMQQNRDRMQDGGATNGTETTPASPK